MHIDLKGQSYTLDVITSMNSSVEMRCLCFTFLGFTSLAAFWFHWSSAYITYSLISSILYRFIGCSTHYGMVVTQLDYSSVTASGSYTNSCFTVITLSNMFCKLLKFKVQKYLSIYWWRRETFIIFLLLKIKKSVKSREWQFSMCYLFPFFIFLHLSIL